MFTKHPHHIIGTTTYGDLTFFLRHGVACTLWAMDHLLDEELEGTIIKAYIAATGDQRWDVPVELAYAALCYVVMHDWYLATQTPVPEKTATNMAAAFEAARTGTITATTSTKKTKKISYKEYLLKALLSKTPEDELLAEANRLFPNLANPRGTYIYWRNRWTKEGTLS